MLLLNGFNAGMEGKVMNQLKIIKKDEETPKHTIAIDLDEEQKIVLSIDTEYLISMGLEHIKYKVSQAKIKAPKRRLREIEDKIIEILCKNGDDILTFIRNVLQNKHSQEMLKAFNMLEIETYILSFMIEKATDEVFEVLKKDELN